METDLKKHVKTNGIVNFCYGFAGTTGFATGGTVADAAVDAAALGTEPESIVSCRTPINDGF
jgi:hypothetical protein